MAKSEYIKRICDDELAFQLECAGAVVVQGPKWCGKTRTSEVMAKSAVKLQDPLRKKEYHQIVQTMPSLLLEGDSPRLIDEWQDEPDLWNLVRATVDERGGAGHFILTGSVVPRDERDDDNEPPRHSGTGRFAWIKMRPMSLAESGESCGAVSLGALFELVREANGALASLTPPQAAAVLEVFRKMDTVLGVIFFGKAVAAEVPAEIQALLDKRAAARKAKDWAESDRLRDEIAAAGWSVKDSRDGQTVTRK